MEIIHEALFSILMDGTYVIIETDYESCANYFEEMVPHLEKTLGIEHSFEIDIDEYDADCAEPASDGRTRMEFSLYLRVTGRFWESSAAAANALEIARMLEALPAPRRVSITDVKVVFDPATIDVHDWDADGGEAVLYVSPHGDVKTV